MHHRPLLPLFAMAGLAFSFVLAAQASAAKPKPPKMVVLSIKPLDEQTRDTQVLTEILMTDLSKTRHFDLIGESDITAMVGFDRQKQLLGCDDTACLAEIGGALGCDYLLLGSIGRVGKRLRLDLKLADARQSRIVVREGTLVESDDQLVDAVRTTLQALLRSYAEERGLAGAAPMPEQTAKQASKPSRVLPYSLVGAGLGLTAAGTGLTVWSVSAKRSLTFSEANTRARVGMIAGGLGLAALATGVVLLASDDPGEAPRTGWVLAPLHGGASFVATGSF